MMAEPQLGKWLWYVGSDESDDEMMQSCTREQAIRDGRDQYTIGESFYIVEARMLASDELKMALGVIETAPFAETRNGEWIEITAEEEE